MSVVIWHNPRCSKSRDTLALIRDQGIEPEIRLYLEDTPNAGEIEDALELLGLPAFELLRRGEEAFREAGLSRDTSEEALIAAMVTWPKLIERPIVFSNGTAKLGRPPRDVLDIL